VTSGLSAGLNPARDSTASGPAAGTATARPARRRWTAPDRPGRRGRAREGGPDIRRGRRVEQSPARRDAGKRVEDPAAQRGWRVAAGVFLLPAAGQLVLPVGAQALRAWTQLGGRVQGEAAAGVQGPHGTGRVPFAQAAMGGLDGRVDGFPGGRHGPGRGGLHQHLPDVAYAGRRPRRGRRGSRRTAGDGPGRAGRAPLTRTGPVDRGADRAPRAAPPRPSGRPATSLVCSTRRRWARPARSAGAPAAGGRQPRRPARPACARRPRPRGPASPSGSISRPAASAWPSACSLAFSGPW